MYEDFEKQINEVMENTVKKLQNGKDEDENKAKAAMFESMVNFFKDFVKKEAEEKPTFNDSLSFYWKSATRMLKFLSKEASKTQVNGVSYCPDACVFAWIRSYYEADDKAAVDKELKEAEERRAKAEAEKERQKFLQQEAARKAREKLESSPEWATLSEEEQKKALQTETAATLRKLQAADRRKETAEKKKAEAEKKKPEPTVPTTSEPVKEEETDDDITLPWDDDIELPWDENASSAEDVPVEKTEPEATPFVPKTTLKDIDGQISLFDIFTLPGVARC